MCPCNHPSHSRQAGEVRSGMAVAADLLGTGYLSDMELNLKLSMLLPSALTSWVIQLEILDCKISSWDEYSHFTLSILNRIIKNCVLQPKQRYGWTIWASTAAALLRLLSVCIISAAGKSIVSLTVAEGAWHCCSNNISYNYSPVIEMRCEV